MYSWVSIICEYGAVALRPLSGKHVYGHFPEGVPSAIKHAASICHKAFSAYKCTQSNIRVVHLWGKRLIQANDGVPMPPIILLILGSTADPSHRRWISSLRPWESGEFEKLRSRMYIDSSKYTVRTWLYKQKKINQHDRCPRKKRDA